MHKYRASHPYTPCVSKPPIVHVLLNQHGSQTACKANLSLATQCPGCAGHHTATQDNTQPVTRGNTCTLTSASTSVAWPIRVSCTTAGLHACK
ncbi:hypothetical protein E2C01_019142 [Portunus trituberculatus]|uniref:Uncharacterized protein n=1 Tax=Portunus trituberculatus TaxID=210409 RepID=A0A5B7DXG7_PORTR|nr:hypothetical protein [Portunus trituberculatus]